MPLKKISVNQSEMQRLFNNHYLRAYERGDLTKVVVKSGKPDPANRQLIDTKSEIWNLFNNRGNYIAKVHAYVKADGTLAASGKPDPKELLIGQNRYVLSRMPNT